MLDRLLCPMLITCACSTCWLIHHVSTGSHIELALHVTGCSASRPSARLFPRAGVYGDKHDISSVSAEDMLSVYNVNCVGPFLVVQQLMKAGHIGGFGGKTLVANVSSKVSATLQGSKRV